MKVANLYFSRVVSLFCALLCAFMLVGCSDNAALESVDYVLHNAQQEPVEALERIRSIDKSSIRGKHNRARYALAYSEALYYNRINSDCDTLVRPLFDYYHDSDNHEERARALYQYALVKYNSNQFTDALFAIEEAHKSLDNIENYKLRGLLYRYEGYIYYGSYLYHNAYDAHKQSKEFFIKAELPAYIHHASFEVGRMASRILNFDTAENELIEAESYAIEANDTYLLCCSIHELCRVYLQTKEFDKCKQKLSLFDTYNYTLNYVSDFYSIKAIVATYENNHDLANDYLRMAEETLTSFDELFTYANYCISLLKKDYNSAIDKYSAMIEQQDNVLYSVLKLPILNNQIDYLRSSVKQELRENEIIKQRNIAIYVIIIIVLVASAIYFYVYTCNKRKEEQRTIASYVETITELNNKNACLTKELRKESFALYDNYLDDLNSLCEIFYSHGETTRESVRVINRIKAIINDMRNDSERMQKLEQIVNLHYDNIIVKLRTIPTVKERDIRFIIYSILGFSSSAIATLLNISTHAVWRLKYNIKTKITESNNIDVNKIFP